MIQYIICDVFTAKISIGHNNTLRDDGGFGLQSNIT